MKTTLLHLLFLSGLCAAKYGPDLEAPACASDCAQQLANGTQAGGLPAICANAINQRSFFQCLVDSCQSHSYGQALAYAISACSNLGADISPLHPIEVRYLAPTPRRRQVPARSASHLSDEPTLSQSLSMNRRFALMLDCQAGPDGLVTLSVANPTKAAARLDGSPGSAGSQSLRDDDDGDDASMENLSSGSLRQKLDGSLDDKEAASSGPDCESEPARSLTALSATSTQAAAPASGTDCPCRATPSSPVPDSTCSRMLQSPAGDEPTPSLPASTVVLASTGSAVAASSVSTTNCPETEQVANVTTVGTGGRPTAADALTSLPSGTALLTSGPPSTSSCLESAATPLTMQPTTDSRPTPSGGGKPRPSAVNGSVASAGEDCSDTSTLASVTAVAAPNSSAPSPLPGATSCEGQMSGQVASCDSCSSQGTQTEPQPSSSTAEGAASQAAASKTPLPVGPSVLRTNCISNSSSSTSLLSTQGAAGSVNATATATAAATAPPTSSLSAPTWTSPSHTPAAPMSVPAAYTTKASPPAYQPPLAAYSFVKTPAIYGASVSGALGATNDGNSSAPGSRPTSATVSGSGGPANGPQAASAHPASTDAASYGLGSGGNDGVGTRPASPSLTPSESPSKTIKGGEYGKGDGSTQRATTTALASRTNGDGTPQEDSSTRCTTASTQTGEGGAAVKGVKEVILVTLISSAANGEMQTRVRTIQQPEPAAAAVAAMTGAAQGRSGVNDDEDRRQPGFLLAVDDEVDKAVRRRSTTWSGSAPAVATGRSCRVRIPSPAVLWATATLSIMTGELLVAALGL